MTDQDVFIMLYGALTDTDRHIQAVLGDDTGHVYIAVESYYSGRRQKRGDSMTYWKFLLSPAPGFASAENQLSRPYHMRVT